MGDLMNEIEASALRDGVAYADRWLEYRREFRDHPGLVAAVQHADDLLLLKGYGYAQLEDCVPMAPNHIFRIASHSKTFTATAIMQLIEQGRLRLDDRASASLPWLSVDITIRQLLNHASGIIRDGHEADFWQVQAEFPDREQLRSISADGAILDANTTFKYSNIGYGLLGLIIEAVTGSAYNDYVREHIIRPLGLEDTGPEVDAGIRDRLVTGYTRARLGVPRQAVTLIIDTHALSPATGFYSTAQDLCRYASAHWMGDARLLTDASKREMQQPYWNIEQADERYGLGFSVREIGKRRLVGHGGGFPGQSTRTLIDPLDRLVVVVLSNTNASDGLAAPLAETVVKIIDYALEHAGLRSAAAERYTGRFASMGGVIDIAAFGDTLVATSPETDDPVARVTELCIVDENTLRVDKGGGYGAPGEPVRYERDGHGNPTRVVAGGVSAYPVETFRARYRGLSRASQTSCV
jgi:CubicO group peptidase (beta-lactamase class C family)